jgi:YidC/Oxa1 family membrane protein insertase
LSIFAQVFGYLLGLIYGLVNDYGIAIIIFTLFTKLLLMPFTIKQMKSSKAMAAIQPKMKEIQEKYKDNKEKQNQMLVELYKEHKYNPMSGCLPLLIQFPIIIGLFTALREPGTYVFVNNPELTLLATQDTFLWIKNLSTPDLMSNIFTTGPAWLLALPGIMPIMSSVLTYFQMSSQNASTQTSGNNAMNNQMKIMQIMFPVMILFWGTSLSAGLILYWTVGSVFQIVQQYVMKTPAKGETK